MKNLTHTFMPIVLFLLICGVLNSQLQDRLYAGPNNVGDNLEICYSVRNTTLNDVTINAAAENQITILYGAAPLNGYFTLPNSCMDISGYNLEFANPSVNTATISSFETQDKFLWLNFEMNTDFTIVPTEEVELFCFSWSIDNANNPCDDLVYWTFCDNDVADTFYDDYNVFPLGSDCTEGDPQQDNVMLSLPVELATFKGKSNGNSNTISWSTVSEINNDYFILQRSSDGIVFDDLAKINGRGTSNAMNSYTYEDRDLQSGIVYYYRLGQYDFNGTYKLISEVISSKANAQTLLNVYPIPAKDMLNLEFENGVSENYTIHIMNVRGKNVYEKIMRNTEKQLDVSQLPVGMYNILIVNEGALFKKKFLKL